jgi:outer membrane protein assembly factor BamB
MAYKTIRLALCCWACAGLARAADWPQSAFDAGHSAASPTALPATLHVHWVLDLPPLKPAWPDQPRLNYDAVYRPLLVGGRVIVASPANDSVTAYDVGSGRQCWRFFSGGPIRLPPASDGARVFAGSDDGWLYALGAEHGNLLWKFKAAPKSRLVVGNCRLIDTWCIRGGPVVADGQVYVAAGIWPFMGIFIHCLDAASGKPLWSNSSDGEAFTLQPHGAMSFGGIAPQGSLAVSGNHLLVPGGRTLPACYDRRTGQALYYEMAGNTGGHEVAADSRLFFCGTEAYDLASGRALGQAPASRVFSGHRLYGLSGDALVAIDTARWDAAHAGHGGQGAGATTRTPPPGGTALIQAGPRLYAGGKGYLAAFDLPLPAGKPPAWQIPLEGTPGALAAGNEHLVAVTYEGRMYCLGARPTAAPAVLSSPAVPPLGPAASQRAMALLKDSGVDAGYALVLGADHGDLARALAEHGALHVVVLEPSAAKAESLRGRLAEAGLYGERVAVCVGDLASTCLPPYFASLAVAEEPAGLPSGAAWCERLFRALHPYHGRAYLKLNHEQGQALAHFAAGSTQGKATLDNALGAARLRRSGGLPGAGNWTHEHADAANTRVSQDSVAKAPMGLLWFGGSSNDAILPRHGHGPQPQVLDGRLVIEEVDGLRCMDIYTGRILWQASIPALGSYYNNTSHQYGANGTGTNYISTPEAIYVRYGRECLRLDPASGKPLPSIPLPQGIAGGPGGDNAIWGYLNVAGQYLIGGAATPDQRSASFHWTKIKPLGKAGKGQKSDASAAPATEMPQAIESRSLFVIDRGSGKLLWSTAAKGRFRHNAICAGGGRLYAIDQSPGQVAAFDLATGKTLWRKGAGVFGTWLSYAATHDVLLEAGRCGADVMSDEPRGMRAYSARDGRELWYDPHTAGPPMVHGDWVLRDYGACGLLDGKPVQISDPLSGALREWHWTRAHGCNTPAGSEYLLTFRSGAAGFYDLARCGGTGNWGGFRASCTNNLVVAGGLVTAPDFTRTCTCSYQNQTSLALYPDPETPMWTYQGSSIESSGPVRQFGVNFGAPGHRLDDNGTLWLEYPRIADGPGGFGDAVRPRVQVAGGPSPLRYFRLHPSLVDGPLPWVCASGVLGVQSIHLALGGPSAQPQRYLVRLYFAEPEDLRPGERPFSVALQGEEVLRDLDVAREAGGPRRGLVRQFHGIRVEDQLVVALHPGGSRPAILSGLEVIAETAEHKLVQVHTPGRTSH